MPATASKAPWWVPLIYSLIYSLIYDGKQYLITNIKITME